ncbi:hypothetical protein MLD63_10460 [Paracoccus sp. TK19116]|uniref:DUF1176 domain-containing protein n=1 Tax=Paracoccus albicereus TaxID=2922394 RepID=A0ABT1MVG7_9RHOB|nr:hypothetical protein [Paracoccus albicereus]MCQ0970846.1 hypothetical protein [Paracoccus albicereus]
MLRMLPLLALVATPVFAQETVPDYSDDRSTPEALVTSLYNAIDRREYLRGWSYFASETAPDYETFRDGYATTEDVELRIGSVETEGAAGSIHSLVPVAIRATDEGGEATVFTGCYRLTQVQPAAQDTPPFRPIQIDDGTLAESDEPFDTAMGTCEP